MALWRRLRNCILQVPGLHLADDTGIIHRNYYTLVRKGTTVPTAKIWQICKFIQRFNPEKWKSSLVIVKELNNRQCIHLMNSVVIPLFQCSIYHSRKQLTLLNSCVRRRHTLHQKKRIVYWLSVVHLCSKKPKRNYARGEFPLEVKSQRTVTGQHNENSCLSSPKCQNVNQLPVVNDLLFFHSQSSHRYREPVNWLQLCNYVKTHQSTRNCVPILVSVVPGIQ